jgi:hypothetical protein
MSQKETLMFNTAILILLYNKEISSSGTVTSLLASHFQFNKTRIVLWNNGPKELSNKDCSMLESLGYDVVIKETINNESLAVIYNQFLAENKADKYILLDDDSNLTESYIAASSEITSNTLGMPLITFLDKPRYPKVSRKRCSLNTTFTKKDKVVTIGSGLVIGDNIVQKLREKYDNFVFDQRFYLYGIDTTFCHRVFVSGLGETIKIIPGFDHRLSLFEKETEEKTNFRKRERSCEKGLRLRYYTSFLKALFILLRVTIRAVKKTILGKPNNVDLSYLFKAFLSGKHYRD